MDVLQVANLIFGCKIGVLSSVITSTFEKLVYIVYDYVPSPKQTI